MQVLCRMFGRLPGANNRVKQHVAIEGTPALCSSCFVFSRLRLPWALALVLWSGVSSVLFVAASVCAIETGSPNIAKPDPWQPNKVVVFGDSLSDSHGDSFRTPEFSHSTYNLLRTLNGEMNTLPDGSQQRPMDLDKILSKRLTIENIRANFDLLVKEIRSEARERSYFGRVLSYMEANAVHAFASLLDSVLRQLDSGEDRVAEGVLPLLTRASTWIARKVNAMPPGSWMRTLLVSIGRKVEYLAVLTEQGIAGTLLDFGDDRIIDIISDMPGAVPLIPDPNYYTRGKWTKGSTGLEPLVWVEFLQKMMSGGGHEVLLDNRSMAGSWTLCASDKMKSINIIDDLTDGVFGGMKMLVQGSMVPPCEGLILQAYMDEARNKFHKTHGRIAKPGDKLFDPDTLVIFFNSANDFLNEWSDPGDVAQEYARDIWTVLSAGARRVAVVLLPDVSDTPRFYPDRSQPKSTQARHLSSLIQNYNTSLSMRLNLLREEFGGDNGYQVMTIDGQRLFAELQKQPHWDLEHPILDIEIPGMAPAAEPEVKAENFIDRELRKNKGFEDTWHIQGVNQASGDKVPFFADTVHPSVEAHHAIAKWACSLMRDKFNVPCYPEAGDKVSSRH